MFQSFLADVCRNSAENEIPQKLDYYETTLGAASLFILLGPYKEDPVKLPQPAGGTRLILQNNRGNVIMYVSLPFAL